MTEGEQSTASDSRWISKPTTTFHGVRVVNHIGETFFLEQVNMNGDVRQSMMFDTDEIDSLVDALEEVRSDHD